MSKKIDSLLRIFSDAHLVDFDLSKWGTGVALCVLSDHYRDWSGGQGRCPLLFVEFLEVTHLEVRFRHNRLPKPEPGVCFQWLIDSPCVEECEDGLRLELSGSHPAAPRLTIAFASYSVLELDHRDIGRDFPNWSRPGRGLIRPGLDVASK